MTYVRFELRQCGRRRIPSLFWGVFCNVVSPFCSSVLNKVYDWRNQQVHEGPPRGILEARAKLPHPLAPPTILISHFVVIHYRLPESSSIKQGMASRSRSGASADIPLSQDRVSRPFSNFGYGIEYDPLPQPCPTPPLPSSSGSSPVVWSS